MNDGNLFPVDPVVSSEGKRSRNRDKEGAGKSDASWRKHEIVAQALMAQVPAWLCRHSPAGVVIFDSHAGDGYGVDNPQKDLFRPNRSQPTPEVAIRLGLKYGVAVALAEIDDERRTSLKERFFRDDNGSVLIADHRVPVASIRRTVIGIYRDCCGAPRELAPLFTRCFIVNDPNGCGTHEFAMLQELGSLMPTDFIVVSNQGWLRRFMGKDHPSLAPHQVHAWQQDLPEWARRLGSRRMSASRLEKQSPSFHHQVLVIANHLADGAKRGVFEDISWKI